MAIIELNRYDLEEDYSITPDDVKDQLKVFFPSSRISPDDQLALQVARVVERHQGPHLTEHDMRFIESEKRKKALYGPCYSFWIPVDNNKEIQGQIRKVNVTFFVNCDIPREVHDRIIEFLQSVGPGTIEDSIDG